MAICAAAAFAAPVASGVTEAQQYTQPQGQYAPQQEIELTGYRPRARCCPNCGRPGAHCPNCQPVQPPQQQQMPQDLQMPKDAPPEAPPIDISPQNTPSLNNSYGFVDTQSSVPWMIGDLFTNSHVDVRYFSTDFGSMGSYSVDYSLSSPSAGGNVGTTKFCENNSPLPRTRVFGFYDLFTDVPLSPNGTNVNRFAPGFELAMFGGQASFELRTPFAVTQDPQLQVDGAGNVLNNGTNNVQFGNLSMTFKELLFQTQTTAWSTGLGVSVPTAKASSVIQNNVEILRIQNDAVHLQPYFAGLYAPNRRFFAQGMIQVDVATNGNRVLATDGINPAVLNQIGTFKDQTFLYVSPTMGYWLARIDEPNYVGLTGWAITTELNYNRSLNNSSLTAGNTGNTLVAIGNNTTSVELINLMLGSTFRWSNGMYATAAYGTPLGGGGDRQFNGQFRFQVNWLFGPGNSSPFAPVF